MPTFFNQATLTYSGGTVNSNIATGEILEVLSVTKTAVVDVYTAASDITYAVNITNASDLAVSGVSLTDDLGAYPFGTETLVPLDYVENSVKYFVDGVLQPSPTVTAGPPLTVSGITVPAGGVATILYTTRTNSFASPEVGGTIVNTATVTGGGGTAVADETVTGENAPNLDLTKSISPATVTENGRVTYTLVIENRGNTAAELADNLVISDTFDPRLTNLEVIYEGTSWTENIQYSYDEATGLFSTLPGQITVPAATFTQDIATGNWSITPGSVILTVTGNIVA